MFIFNNVKRSFQKAKADFTDLKDSATDWILFLNHTQENTERDLALLKRQVYYLYTENQKLKEVIENERILR